MKSQKWIIALALAFCFIARPGYSDDSYDYKGIASWENAVWAEKAAGRYSIMGETSLYSIWGKGGWPGLEEEGGRAGKYSIWGEGGWPGLDVDQGFIPSALTLYEGEHALFEDFVARAHFASMTSCEYKVISERAVSLQFLAALDISTCCH